MTSTPGRTATPTSRAPARPVGPSFRPTAGRLPRPSDAIVVRVVLVAVALAITGMWWLDAPASTVHGTGPILQSVGRMAALLGSYLVLVQLVLLARIPWFERAVGLERLTKWHRALGTNLVILISGHVLSTVWGYALVDHQALPTEGWRVIRGYPDVWLATIAYLVFVAVAVTSAWWARQRLAYEAWYAIHVSVYVAVAVAFFHQIRNGEDFLTHPLNRWLWILLYLAVAAIVVGWRVVPLVRLWRSHGLRVETVERESPDTVSVWLTGDNLTELRAAAGQFFLWRFLCRGHWLAAHPYSLSIAPDGQRLRITVKDAGDHSGGLGDLRPHTRVLAEGPFGHFVPGTNLGRPVLLVAGGSGIGPIRALAESFGARRRGPDDVVLLYRAHGPADLALRDELDAMAEAGWLRVHYLLGRRAQLRQDPLSRKSLAHLVPDLRRRQLYVCGPPGMNVGVIRAALSLGLHPEAIHVEDFGFE